MATQAQQIAMGTFLCEEFDDFEGTMQLLRDGLLDHVIWGSINTSRANLAATIELLSVSIQKAMGGDIPFVDCQMEII